MEEKDKVLKLQQDFEAGNVMEEELTEEEISALEDLYNEQISLLKQMKEVYQNKVNCHKESIKKNLELIKKLKK